MSHVIPPYVNSPYAGRTIKVWEHLMLASYWFATNFHWGAILILLLPGDIEKMFPDTKSTILGLTVAIGAVAALFVPLIAGALSDRCVNRLGRRRPFVAAGISINVIGLLGMALTVTFHKSLPAPLAFYLLSFLIVQTGNNITSGAYMGLIPDLVEPHQRGHASGYMALMSQVGTLFGAAGIGALMKDAPTLAKYGVIAAVLIIVGLIARFGIKETPLKIRPPSLNWGEYVKSLWIDPRQFPDFAWVWFTRFLVMCGFYAMTPYLNYYLQDVINIQHKELGEKLPIFMGIILLLSSVSGVLGGSLSDKIGRKKIVYVANGLLAVIIPLFIFCRTLEQALIVGGLFGLAYGAYISVDYALGTDVLPNQEEAGKDMAIWHVSMTLPQSIATPIAGLLIALPGFTKIPTPPGEDPITKYFPLGYAYLFVFSAVCFGLGALLLRNVRSVK